MANSERYDEFVSLIRLHTSQVLAYINALLVNWNDAEDLFQETCLVMWQKFDEFEPGTNFLAWALRIAEHKVMNFQKTRSRRVAFTERLRESLKSDFVVQKVEDGELGLAALSRCMDKLTENDRRMTTLCYGEGQPAGKVADAMNCSTRSVYRSLLRIRTWLLECVRRELDRADAPPSAFKGQTAREESP